MKKSLIFFGTEDFSAASLSRLINDGWPIAAVVTKPSSKRGRGQKLEEPQVKQIADTHNIPVFQPAKPSDIIEQLVALGCEFGVLVSYGKIIPQQVLDIFPGGIINLHPSLLPKYRGPSPIEAAILNGDKATGITLMKLTADMDAGPIYAQLEVPLTGTENQSHLYKELAQDGASFLADNLEKIIEGTLLAQLQSEQEATYTKLISKEDGRLNPDKDSAELLERKIRAYCQWPRCKTSVNGREIIVTQASVVDSENDAELVIQCSPGFLSIERLIIPGGKEISAKEYVRGYSK